MTDKSLDEIVRQLEGETRQATRLEPAVSPAPAAEADAVDDLVEGLRATEWLLSDLRERCRQLHGYRLRLIDKLQRLENGELDGLPFMPEMLAFCGQSLRVAKRADKTCDSIAEYSGADARRYREIYEEFGEIKDGVVKSMFAG